jgi:hypothetical protein
MNPMVILLVLFALSKRQTAKPKRAVMALPAGFDCGNVDAVASEMANHMRGTMTPEATQWYADSEGQNPPREQGILSVLATWTHATLAETGGPMPFPWARDGGGPWHWVAVRDNPATLPPGCAEQIREAVARSWAVVSLSL